MPETHEVKQLPKLQQAMMVVSIILGIISIMSWLVGGMSIIRAQQNMQDNQAAIVKELAALTSRVAVTESDLQAIEIRHAVQDAIDGRAAEELRRQEAKKKNHNKP